MQLTLFVIYRLPNSVSAKRDFKHFCMVITQQHARTPMVA